MSFSIIKRYGLQIIGSFILVLSWYYEKVEVAKHENEIVYAKELRLIFRLQMNHSGNTSFISEQTRYNHSHDSKNATAEMVLYVYAEELRQKEYLNAEGMSMSLSENHRDRKIISDKYEKRIIEINNMVKNNQLAKIIQQVMDGREMQYGNEAIDQGAITNRIIKEQKAIDNTYKLVLIFYAIGIILITINNIILTFQRIKEEKNITDRLNKIKEQNIHLLKKKS